MHNALPSPLKTRRTSYQRSGRTAAGHIYNGRAAPDILAAECVWLKELVEPFVETVVALLDAPSRPSCVLAFRERAVETSETFSSLAAVVTVFRERGVGVEARGSLDAPESRGLMTTFYEIRKARAT